MGRSHRYGQEVVFNCATVPDIHLVQNPVKLGWQPLVKVEHYRVEAREIIDSIVLGTGRNCASHTHTHTLTLTQK